MCLLCVHGTNSVMGYTESNSQLHVVTIHTANELQFTTLCVMERPRVKVTVESLR